MNRYHERVWPSAWMFIAALLVIPATVLVFLRINVWVGVFLGIAIYAGYVALLIVASPVVEVSNRQLRVGSARIPLTVTGDVTAYSTREAARVAAGPDLDARAWLCLRGWAPTSARVDVTDPVDPVPYWLFSTRNPDAVRAAIEAARATQARDDLR
ncbi:hypothetical protein GCM10011490_04580 [Pseudoclavibacter endophyticus]|uniref:DUF3093 domain-containing protein n=1 Tax=Pseudoclavibacter endophyticus TaxID=1778590 RepID=A0A6H9WGI0_9MICO|nr:DUF3093 domain-containing protein [Pseudoclavibacter endophyticus]KAB1650032.1 DUF3093 domain-containing protein [Pseudoclavibacter endophyticus]GGA57804.1 hypothetical protein GCM10011490_04580 [Pseudoclavibacter endophyticus]